MLTLGFLSNLIIFLVSFLVYITSATIAGYFHALIALKLGDDTPAQNGFLNWNPFIHFSPFGFLVLMWSGYGLTPFAPMDADKIQGALRYIKIFLAYYSKFFCALLIAIFSFIVLIYFYPGAAAEMVIKSFSEGEIPLQAFKQFYPGLQSLKFVLGLMLTSAVFQNAFLATCDFLVATIYLLLYYFKSDFLFSVKYNSVLNLVLSFLILYLFVGYVLKNVIYLIFITTHIFAGYLG